MSINHNPNCKIDNIEVTFRVYGTKNQRTSTTKPFIPNRQPQKYSRTPYSSSNETTKVDICLAKKSKAEFRSSELFKNWKDIVIDEKCSQAFLQHKKTELKPAGTQTILYASPEHFLKGDIDHSEHSISANSNYRRRSGTDCISRAVVTDTCQKKNVQMIHRLTTKLRKNDGYKNSSIFERPIINPAQTIPLSSISRIKTVPSSIDGAKTFYIQPSVNHVTGERISTEKIISSTTYGGIKGSEESFSGIAKKYPNDRPNSYQKGETDRPGVVRFHDSKFPVGSYETFDRGFEKVSGEFSGSGKYQGGRNLEISDGYVGINPLATKSYEGTYGSFTSSKDSRFPFVQREASYLQALVDEQEIPYKPEQSSNSESQVRNNEEPEEGKQRSNTTDLGSDGSALIPEIEDSSDGAKGKKKRSKGSTDGKNKQKRKNEQDGSGKCCYNAKADKSDPYTLSSTQSESKSIKSQKKSKVKKNNTDEVKEKNKKSKSKDYGEKPSKEQKKKKQANVSRGSVTFQQQQDPQTEIVEDKRALMKNEKKWGKQKATADNPSGHSTLTSADSTTPCPSLSRTDSENANSRSIKDDVQASGGDSAMVVSLNNPEETSIESKNSKLDSSSSKLIPMKSSSGGMKSKFKSVKAFQFLRKISSKPYMHKAASTQSPRKKIHETAWKQSSKHENQLKKISPNDPNMETIMVLNVGINDPPAFKENNTEKRVSNNWGSDHTFSPHEKMIKTTEPSDSDKVPKLPETKILAKVSKDLASKLKFKKPEAPSSKPGDHDCTNVECKNLKCEKKFEAPTENPKVDETPVIKLWSSNLPKMEQGAASPKKVPSNNLKDFKVMSKLLSPQRSFNHTHQIPRISEEPFLDDPRIDSPVGIDGIPSILIGADMTGLVRTNGGHDMQLDDNPKPNSKKPKQSSSPDSKIIAPEPTIPSEAAKTIPESRKSKSDELPDPFYPGKGIDKPSKIIAPQPTIPSEAAKIIPESSKSKNDEPRDPFYSGKGIEKPSPRATAIDGGTQKSKDSSKIPVETSKISGISNVEKSMKSSPSAESKYSVWAPANEPDKEHPKSDLDLKKEQKVLKDENRTETHDKSEPKKAKPKQDTEPKVLKVDNSKDASGLGQKNKSKDKAHKQDKQVADDLPKDTGLDHKGLTKHKHHEKAPKMTEELAQESALESKGFKTKHHAQPLNAPVVPMSEPKTDKHHKKDEKNPENLPADLAQHSELKPKKSKTKNKADKHHKNGEASAPELAEGHSKADKHHKKDTKTLDELSEHKHHEKAPKMTEELAKESALESKGFKTKHHPQGTDTPVVSILEPKTDKHHKKAEKNSENLPADLAQHSELKPKKEKHHKKDTKPLDELSEHKHHEKAPEMTKELAQESALESKGFKAKHHAHSPDLPAVSILEPKTAENHKKGEKNSENLPTDHPEHSELRPKKSQTKHKADKHHKKGEGPEEHQPDKHHKKDSKTPDELSADPSKVGKHPKKGEGPAQELAADHSKVSELRPKIVEKSKVDSSKDSKFESKSLETSKLEHEDGKHQTPDGLTAEALSKESELEPKSVKKSKSKHKPDKHHKKGEGPNEEFAADHKSKHKTDRHHKKDTKGPDELPTDLSKDTKFEPKRLEKSKPEHEADKLHKPDGIAPESISVGSSKASELEPKSSKKSKSKHKPDKHHKKDAKTPDELSADLSKDSRLDPKALKKSKSKHKPDKHGVTAESISVKSATELEHKRAKKSKTKPDKHHTKDAKTPVELSADFSKDSRLEPKSLEKSKSPPPELIPVDSSKASELDPNSAKKSKSKQKPDKHHKKDAKTPDEKSKSKHKANKHHKHDGETPETISFDLSKDSEVQPKTQHSKDSQLEPKSHKKSKSKHKTDKHHKHDGETQETISFDLSKDSEVAPHHSKESQLDPKSDKKSKSKHKTDKHHKHDGETPETISFDLSKDSEVDPKAHHSKDSQLDPKSDKKSKSKHKADKHHKKDTRTSEDDLSKHSVESTTPKKTKSKIKADKHHKKGASEELPGDFSKDSVKSKTLKKSKSKHKPDKHHKKEKESAETVDSLELKPSGKSKHKADKHHKEPKHHDKKDKHKKGTRSSTEALAGDFSDHSEGPEIHKKSKSKTDKHHKESKKHHDKRDPDGNSEEDGTYKRSRKHKPDKHDKRDNHDKHHEAIEQGKGDDSASDISIAHSEHKAQKKHKTKTHKRHDPDPIGQDVSGELRFDEPFPTRDSKFRSKKHHRKPDPEMYGDVGPGRVECESKYKLDQYGERQCAKDCKLNISDMSVSSTTSWLLCEVIKPNTPVSRNTKRRKGFTSDGKEQISHDLDHFYDNPDEFSQKNHRPHKRRWISRVLCCCYF